MGRGKGGNLVTAVVVGSGPNGLAAAATLAQAGVDVTVIEQAMSLGGGARSVRTDAGVLHDECSGFHPFAVDNEFTRCVDLGAHGLEWAWPDVQFTSPIAGSTDGVACERSVDVTAAGLGPDRSAWLRMFSAGCHEHELLSFEALRPPLHVPKHPFVLGGFGIRAALPATAWNRTLRSPRTQSLWLGLAAHACQNLSSPFSSSIGLALGVAAQTVGWPVARGGSASIVLAMESFARERGARFETGRAVSSLDELGRQDIVLLDTSPAAARRIIGDRMPARMARAYERFRHGPAAFKVDFAVEGGVPWLHEASRRAGTVHVGGSADELLRAESLVSKGVMPERPFVLVGQQYLADHGRSFGDVHPVYSYAHVPAGFAGDATQQILDQIERVAPGFKERITETRVRSTTQLAQYNPNYIGGDILTGASTARQLLGRPRLSPWPFLTGVPNVYLCSAATSPGAGAHGMCGYLAAEGALRRIRAG